MKPHKGKMNNCYASAIRGIRELKRQKLIAQLRIRIPPPDNVLEFADEDEENPLPVWYGLSPIKRNPLEEIDLQDD